MEKLWADLTTDTFKALRVNETAEMVILPIGSTEDWGPHVPLGGDYIVAWETSLRVARAMDNVYVLPVIPYGVSEIYMKNGTLSLSPETFKGILRDIFDSLARQGVKRMMVVNTHVQNVDIIVNVSYEFREKILVYSVYYWALLKAIAPDLAKTNEYPEGHGSETVTAVLLAVNQDLVKMKQARRELPRPLTNKLLRFTPYDRSVLRVYKGFYNIPLYATEVTPSAVVGDPLKATKEQGEEYLRRGTEYMVMLINELKGLTLEDLKKVS